MMLNTRPKHRHTQAQKQTKSSQSSLNQWKYTVAICVHLHTSPLGQTQAMFAAEHEIQKLLRIPLPAARH